MEKKPAEDLHLPAPKGGQVMVTAKPTVTEREIVQERGNIIQTLHAAYLTLNDAMAEFQQRWDANPAMSIAEGVIEGTADGGSTWLSDQAEMFEKQYWQQLGKQIEEFAGGCIDRLAIYSRQQYNDLARDVNRLVADPDKTIYNWAWWQQSIEGAVSGAAQEQIAKLEALEADARRTARAVAGSAEKARKLYKHRAAIMNLPVLIAEGDPKPIQAFVENELMDIDPELAKAIRGDQRFAIVLEVLADNETTLTYIAYAGLMIEAIPPNFVAYIAGKGAMYLIIELVLLLATALLSAGTAAAARIATLLARLAMTGARLSGASRKFQRAKIAIAAFVRAIEDLQTAVTQIHQLGPKLISARSKGLVVTGRTETKLLAKKQSIRRDKRCRICGSTKHPTPRNRRGTVVYK
ncbi:hypothetical protein [Pseudoduganella umbonata]|uniref:Uncharacterized protein n=1 Tax=Pseudoduganella umbonata TaxID=864828 RepID=A0A4P8HYW5_9BURK|nr:hypothetical protein [Pseudoduganella umbonata]MBB3222027.1 hypothetical protein [Pseudoduganella umbonata]QCP14188.1 hypothetical protein FCL38_30060 [Pseudoduganella umbonata]